MRADSTRKFTPHPLKALIEVGNRYGIKQDEQELYSRFSKLELPQVNQISKSFFKFAEVLEKAELEQIDITKNVDFLKFWLKETGIEAPFEIEKYVSDGDIVEVYDHDLIQVFRNHTFYQFCSYDPLTLATTPFPVLFKRDDEVNRVAYEHVRKCLDGNTKVHKIQIPKHTMQEHFARNSKVYEIEHKYCSPLFKHGSREPIAIFCTQKAKYIGDSNITGIGKVYDH